VLTFHQITGLPVPARLNAASGETTGAIPVSELDLRVSRLGRGERLITWSRVALAAFALVAVWIDPPGDPVPNVLVAYSLLLGYLVYAVVLALVLSSIAAPLPRVGVVAHGVDLANAIAVNALTGADSPFFVLFVFLLVAAALRWQWRGIVVTGAVVLFSYLLVGLLGAETLGMAAFDLDRFIMRGANLAIVAVLLGFLGTWEGRLRRDLVELSDFPRKRYTTFEDAARASLGYAAGILRAPRVMLAWEDSEEPWLETLLLEDGDARRERHEHGALSPLVPDSLRDGAFLCLDLSVEQPTSVRTAPAGVLAWRGQPLHAELARRMRARNVISVPVVGEGVNARLFAFDKTQLTSDDLVVALILARQIVGVLEQHFLMVETRQSAANQERIRVARELHDGVAQSLAAAAFHVRGLRGTLASDPIGAQAGLDEVERLLVDEQRELRLFMQELRPWSASSEESTTRARLLELCHRVAILWGVDVDLESVDEIATPNAWDAYRLAQEGLINAARHAQASRIRLAVSNGARGVTIKISDDGRGFPFQGAYDLATLEERKIGPVSLKERIASLGGDLMLRTGEAGTELEISLPSTSRGAA